jgi:hypothetical protein
VAISLGVPRGWKGRRYRALAPTRELLTEWKKGYLTWDLYIRFYREQVLDELDPMEVATDLNRLIMCCWEKHWQECHRSLVAFWLQEATGEKVPEWEPGPSYRLVQPYGDARPLPPGELEDRLDRLRPHTTVEEGGSEVRG